MSASHRGRVSFADVPFEAAGYRRLLYPLAFLTNAAMALWIYPCWKTARIRWVPALDGLVEFSRTIRRPLIFYSWHAYEQLTLCALRDMPPDLVPTGIGHDGLPSRMLQRSTAWFGFRVWSYRRRSPIPPRQQIIDMVRSRGCNIGLFADAGGPYGKVKPGLAEIARATEAYLVPFVVLGRPIVMVRRPVRYGFPLPFCTLVGYHSTPLDGRDATVEECQAALDALERRASAAPPDGRPHLT